MLRLSTGEMYRSGLDEMLLRQADLMRTQLKLSTGKNILTPSDDPSGSVQAMEFRDAVAETRQYLRNITLADRRLELEDGVLAGVGNVIQRAHELAVQAANASTNAQNRVSIAYEVRQLFDELLQLANTVDANGEYIFGGTQSLGEAFTAAGLTVTYNGDTGVREVQISDSRRMPIGHSGQEAFMDADIFGKFGDYITALEANDQAGIQQAINDLNAALEHTLNLRSVIGGRLNTLTNQRAGHEMTQLQYEEMISSIEDLDYAKAISDFQLQMAGLQASQQSYLMVQRLSLFDYLR